MFTFATTLSAVGAVAACSSSSSTGPATDAGSTDGTVNDDGQVQAAYGCPEPECGQVDSGLIDDGGAAPLYGASVEDSGTD